MVIIDTAISEVGTWTRSTESRRKSSSGCCGTARSARASTGSCMETTRAAAVNGGYVGIDFRDGGSGCAESRRMSGESCVLDGSQFLSEIRPVLDEFTSLLPASLKLLRRNPRELGKEPLSNLVLL